MPVPDLGGVAIPGLYTLPLQADANILAHGLRTHYALTSVFYFSLSPLFFLSFSSSSSSSSSSLSLSLSFIPML